VLLGRAYWAAAVLNFFRSLWTAPRGFPEQSMLDARRARLMAAIAFQVAGAKVERAAQLERVESARIVAEREGRAAAMRLAALPAASATGWGADRPLNGAARWPMNGAARWPSASGQAGRWSPRLVAEGGKEEVARFRGESPIARPFTWTEPSGRDVLRGQIGFSFVCRAKPVPLLAPGHAAVPFPPVEPTHRIDQL